MQGGPFLIQGLGNPADRRARTRAASSRTLAPELLAELRTQNAALPPSASRSANLERLGQPGTAAVLTGQQVGLFLGPLYTVFKAASAIAVARALEAETGIPCVPVFWLQTEDHDFAEMASCLVPRSRQEPLRLALDEEPRRARSSIADRTLGSEVDACLGALTEELRELPHASEVIGVLRTHYRPGTSPGRAFAGVLAELFADDGLVLYDPRQAVAARLLVPVIRTSLTEAARLDAGLLERSRQLEAAGFAVQIPVREQATLAFFHLGEARGPRYRLSRHGSEFGLPQGETQTLDQLLAVLEREPLRFSTSALLRPIAQDTLFPTAVYVGGPAEVDYFAQLPPLYAHFGLEPPLVALRARFRLVPARVRDLLQRLSLSGADLDRPIEELRAPLRTAEESRASPGPAWLAEVEGRLDAYARGVPEGDRAMRRSVERTRATLRVALERLAARHRARRSGAADSRLAQLDEVARWLRPHGVPQERTYSFPAFAARLGLRAFGSRVLQAVVPFDAAVREIDL